MPQSKSHTDPMDFSLSVSKETYRHIALTIDGDEATILLNVDPDGGLRDDVALKLNSYDLSVDIELADAISRLRFEYPQVRVVTITSAHPQVFSSGANIYMLKKSSHAFKVNFCKYTNETRLYMEEASRFSNLKFLCALNGTAAGGGYELAMACDRIVLLDDKSANVSLPEVPLLGVLPGTGGLTRLTDKRKTRKDLADVFSTVSEGIKGKKAQDLGLVDKIYAKSQWVEGIKREIAQLKPKINNDIKRGIKVPKIHPVKNANGFSYQYVDVKLGEDRIVEIEINAPFEKEPTNAAAMLEKGSDLWLFKAFRELDDALLRLRFFYRDHGLLQFRAKGDPSLVLEAERPLYDVLKKDAHWFLRELLLHISRVFRRLDVNSRSMISVIEPGCAYAGVLAELLFACDRSYALDDENSQNHIWLSPINAGPLITWSETSRLELRFLGHDKKTAEVLHRCTNSPIGVKQAYDLGLITFLLDDIDFSDELRIFKEERASLSPDALSAMEANLRFNGPETLATKIFGRLSAWQNWVFIRENATGAHGALISYGEETRPSFDWERC